MKENIFIKDKLKKIAISNFLKKKLKGAGFVDVEVVKTSLYTRVIIYALKPGFIIGKKGSNIRGLTEDIENQFGLSKVHIEIGEILNKNLDAKVIMESIQSQIGRGTAWKTVVYNALKGIKEAGAIGAEIIAKGNTSGKGQRKRKSRFFFGYMKKAGDQKNLVICEKRTTFPGLGTIGITLRIVTPDILFSDKVDVKKLATDFKIRMEEDILEKRKEKMTDDSTKAKTEEKEVVEETHESDIKIIKKNKKVVSKEETKIDEVKKNDVVEKKVSKKKVVDVEAPKKKKEDTKAIETEVIEKKEEIIIETEDEE